MEIFPFLFKYSLISYTFNTAYLKPLYPNATTKMRLQYYIGRLVTFQLRGL
jgi:hypothetical protein